MFIHSFIQKCPASNWCWLARVGVGGHCVKHRPSPYGRRRQWQPTPVLLPGESHGQRSLMGYSPWGHKELDSNEATEHAQGNKKMLELLCLSQCPVSFLGKFSSP